MEEQKSIRDVLASLDSKIEDLSQGKKGKPKSKVFRMPSKGKVSKSQQTKGYATIVVIKENKAVEISKEEIIDSVVRHEDTFHSVEGNDVLSYRGKPLVIVSKIKKNAWNPDEGFTKNETAGQKQIMSRMMNEVIIGAKKKVGWGGISIGIIILAGVLIYALVAG